MCPPLHTQGLAELNYLIRLLTSLPQENEKDRAINYGAFTSYFVDIILSHHQGLPATVDTVRKLEATWPSTPRRRLTGSWLL